MKAKELRKLGKNLGKGWQSKLAELMPCNPRTVRKWISGERRISKIVEQRIKQVIEDSQNGDEVL